MRVAKKAPKKSRRGVELVSALKVALKSVKKKPADYLKEYGATYTHDGTCAYDEKYDAYYVIKTGEWAERKCEDPDCQYCNRRPPKHIDSSE